MKKVQMRSRYNGPCGTCEPEGVIEVPDDEAKQLVEGKFGKVVSGSEAAALEASEQATKGKPKKKKRKGRK